MDQSSLRSNDEGAGRTGGEQEVTKERERERDERRKPSDADRLLWSKQTNFLMSTPVEWKCSTRTLIKTLMVVELYVWVDYSAQEDIKELKLAADLAASSACMDFANKLAASKLDE